MRWVKKQSKDHVLWILLRLYKTALAECPVRMMIYSLVLLANGGIQIVITYGMELFFNSVSIGVQREMLSRTIFLTFLFLITSILASHILNGCDNYLGTSIHVVLIGKFEEHLHKKAVKMEPALFEDVNFLDDINKALQGSGLEGCTFVLVAFMVVTFSQLPYVILMSIYLYTLKPLLAICILMVCVPVVISQYIRIHIFAKLEDETVQDRRVYHYYSQCITEREYFKETRMLGAYPYFADLIRKTIEKINDKAWICYGKMVRMEIFMRLITLMGYVGVILLLIIYVMDGSIALGAFAAVFSSIGVMFETMESAVGQQLGGVFESIGMVENYFRFLDMEEMQGREDEVDYTQGIQMKNVSFSYKGNQKAAVHDVDLNVKNGETIAIVGENGAGKSTLVKLLMGLYKPDCGEVRIGGVSTKTTKMQYYHEKVSGVFQNYQKYKMTLKDNIVISDSRKSKPEKIIQALDRADIDVIRSTYPEGMDTILSAEFGGTDISGGQWQRIAIARGIYREYEIIILDEPTAAIDPLEEYALYNKFREMAKNKIAILVTHRLGSCKIADRVIVMENGKIVEEGTHTELMKKMGKYRELYMAQAQWYV